MDTHIALDLSQHCIETEAKNTFKRLMDTYFESPEADKNLEIQIELLRDFIEDADFKKLRSSDERLAGGEECTVTITKDNTGKFVLSIT